jgi:hypothetical protein
MAIARDGILEALDSSPSCWFGATDSGKTWCGKTWCGKTWCGKTWCTEGATLPAAEVADFCFAGMRPFRISNEY